MGKTYSKEETVIAQNANGEANASTSQNFGQLISVEKILLIIILIVLLVGAVYFIAKKCQKNAVKVLRRELNASTFSVASQPQANSAV